MAFDSKYFTGNDSNSYFTENSNLYKSSQGLTIGEELGFGNNPLSSIKKSVEHGFQTLMIGFGAPGQGRGNEGIGNMDRISQQQLDASAEMLRLNKMNFISHAPFDLDLMGISGEAGKAQEISAEKREENLRVFKKVIANTDSIAKKADLKNIPLTIHPVNSIGAQDELFDSGFKDNDGNIVYGKTGTMIKKDTGQLAPMKSTFKWLPIKEYSSKDNKGLYKKINGTQKEDYALFEITPDQHLNVANRTALDDFYKKTSDAEIKMKQIERDTFGINTKVNDQQKSYLQENNPGYRNLLVEINSLQSEIAHASSPQIGGRGGGNLFIKATDYANQIIPEQISKLALASYKTKSQPVLAIENLPVHQFGSPKDVVTIVEESRKKFAEKLQQNEGLDRDAANKKSNELIGLTLDIGHLNTFKSKINPATNKFWTDDDLKKETKKMAKSGVKLVHIADNIGEFGRDSHLMIGRGNAKIDEMLDILKQNGFKGQAAIESYEGEGDFDKVWARNNMKAMGSMYQSGKGPSVIDVDMSAQYSSRNSNYGHNVSNLHWSQWGGPFAGMHTTFGGGGKDKRDSFSGTPTN
jgi:Xylose isomerase-like TIM barrel